MEFYNQLKQKISEIAEDRGVMGDVVRVEVKVLSSKEAIGDPSRRDFPLLKGREYMIEADFKGFRGQAFTDDPGDFEGSISDILQLPLDNNKNRAVFIAALNALANYLNLAEGTVHCRNEEPEKCSQKLVEYIKEKYGNVRIGMVGLQPAMLDRLRRDFEIRVLDLDPENVGTYKYDVLIEHGEDNLEDVKNWAHLLLVTGSSVVNGTIVNFINLDIPVIFYGNTVAGAAALMHLERVCFHGSN